MRRPRTIIIKDRDGDSICTRLSGLKTHVYVRVTGIGVVLTPKQARRAAKKLNDIADYLESKNA